jgi:hypothetical protein
VKILSKRNADVNKTMGELGIGSMVEITPRTESNHLFNVIMPNLKGDSLDNLWGEMPYAARRNAGFQIKAVK